MNRLTWTEYALKLAATASERSEDPWLKVGAVVLRQDNSVAGIGYNGAPPDVNVNFDNRDTRRALVLHAELNALRYTTLNDTRNGWIAVTHLPCSECLKTIASYQIQRVCYSHTLDPNVYDMKHIYNVAHAFNIELELHTNA